MSLRGLTLFALALAAVAAHAADVVQFTVAIRDDAGAPLAARVCVRDAAGRSYLPPVAVTENIGPDTWFACRGSARLDVPAGNYHVEVERGPEYMNAAATVSLAHNATREFRLHRWIDMAARGYRSGEDHLHVPVSMLPDLMAAEDLDYGTSLQWWNGPKFDVPANVPAAITPFDAEIENAWGAVYCIGLARPMPIAWNPARPNLAYIDAARADGALVWYQGGWSAEALLDALLGKVDGVNIGDNLFHRHKFMPRSRNSNLVGAAGLPVYPDTAEGMLALATESYYRLLNCGLHLAAGAASATGVKSSPAGYNRAYVRVPAGASAREFLEAWRQGRNFVTNGPMLFLTVDGREPGDTLAVPAAGGPVRVHIEAESAWSGELGTRRPRRVGLNPGDRDAAGAGSLPRVSLIVNGTAVQTSTSGALDATISITAGAWIAALATAEEPASDAELARYRQASRLGGEEPTRLHFAQTSPVYVTVGGAGARVPRSLDEARRMLDGFEAFARKTAAPEYLPEVESALTTARAKLEAH